MKRFFSIALLQVLLLSSLSLTFQYVYQEYLCEDTQEYLEVAGRKITVCGKICSMDDLKHQSQNAPQPNKHQYNTEIPPLYLIGEETSHVSLNAQDIDHLSGEFCFYKFIVADNLIEPPTS